MGLSPSAHEQTRASSPSPSLPEAAWFVALRRRMVKWFERHGRDLPWRRSTDAYAIWLSEVMLQQTTVAMVLPHFERFLARFPNVASLAAADEGEVLRCWEGLGYYRRARQLHSAARQIMANHDGQVPPDFAAVLALPGVGRYTAGAILAFAFDQPHPIIEANTTRVWARLLAYPGDTLATEGQRLLWAAAAAVLPKRAGGRAINLALMDLGATLCTPRDPRCDACPVAIQCHARLQDRQNELPRAKASAAPTAMRQAAVVVRRRGRVLLLRCADGQRWAGMWDFPRFAIASGNGPELGRELADNLRRLAGVTIRPSRHLATLRHSVTRYRITLECFEAESVGVAGSAGQEACWVRPSDLGDYALNVTARKLAGMIRR